MGFAIVYVVFFIFILISMVKKKNKISKSIFLYSIFILYINLIAFLISVGKIGFSNALMDTLYMCVPFITVTIGYQMANKINLNYIIKLAFILGLIEVFIVLMQAFSPSIRDITYRIFANYDKYIIATRTVGTIGNPNHLGLFSTSIFIIVATGWLYSNKNNFNLLKYITVAAVFFTPVFFGKSKTSLIAFALSNVLLIIFSKVRLRLKSGLIVVVVGLVYYAYNLFISYSNRSIDLESMSGRTDIWNKLLDIFINHGTHFNIWLGYGIQHKETVADNYYLQFLIIYGISGLILYLIVIFSFILFIIMGDKSYNIKSMALMLITLLILSDYTAVTSLSQKTSFLIFFLLGYLLKQSGKGVNRRKDYLNLRN